MGWTPLRSRPVVSNKAWLGVILAVAVVARWVGISAESLWLDEATSLMLARMPLGTMIEWTALDIHPPLYYGLLHFWTMLGTSELVVRGLSALAGVLAVWVTFGLGAELFDEPTGLVAAALLALAPFHVWYSQEARMYACLTLFISAALLAALRFLRRTSWMALFGYVLAMAAALYSHYYGIFGFGLANLFWLIKVLAKDGDRPPVWRWILAQVAVIGLFARWIPTFLLPITVGGGGWVSQGLGKPGPSVLAQTFVHYITGTAREVYPALARRAAYGLFAAVLMLGTWPWWRSDTKPVDGTENSSWSPRMVGWLATLYLALPPLLAFGASVTFKPMYASRYMLPFIVPFCLLVGRGVTRLPGRWFRAGVLVALLVIMAYGVVAQVQTMEKPDWRGVAAQITDQAQPDDLVVFMPGWHAKPYRYYADKSIQICDELPIPVPRYEQQVRDDLAQALEGHARVWFVWEEDHYTDPRAVVYAELQEHFVNQAERSLEPIGRVILFEQVRSDD